MFLMINRLSTTLSCFHGALRLGVALGDTHYLGNSGIVEDASTRMSCCDVAQLRAVLLS